MVLAVLESTLPSFCLSYKIKCQETTVTVLMVFAVPAVVAVSVVTATLEIGLASQRNPRGRIPQNCCGDCCGKIGVLGVVFRGSAGGSAQGLPGAVPGDCSFQV